jgi:hypothetical protein
VEVLKQSSQDANLPDILDRLSEELLREYGSDPAFYIPMRREAEQLEAKLPERVLKA